MQKLIRIVIIAASTAIIATSCVKEDEGDILKVGNGIPDFTVSGPAGTFSSSALTGRGGMIVLFASYCPTCQAVMPEIEKLWQTSADGDLFVVAPLSRQQVYDETEEGVARYWQAKGYTMPYYLDIKGEVYYKFAKETIPRLYVVDKQGTITFMSVGDSGITAGKVASELEKALGIRIEI